ncbi:hypothetical protein P5V15_009265 [Pogonomyrmex californicus]
MKGLARKRDLNRGPIIGVKKIPKIPKIQFSVLKGKSLKKFAKLQQKYQIKPKRIKLSSLKREWASLQMNDRKIESPFLIEEDIFDDFETSVLESKLVSCMTDLGHKNHIIVFVVTGNGNGLAEFVVAKTPVQKAALKIANNRASLRLIYILRYKEHTVLHDFFTQLETKIFMKKMQR